MLPNLRFSLGIGKLRTVNIRGLFGAAPMLLDGDWSMSIKSPNLEEQPFDKDILLIGRSARAPKRAHLLQFERR